MATIYYTKTLPQTVNRLNNIKSFNTLGAVIFPEKVNIGALNFNCFFVQKQGECKSQDFST